jgi:hypothetical protein
VSLGPYPLAEFPVLPLIRGAANDGGTWVASADYRLDIEDNKPQCALGLIWVSGTYGENAEKALVAQVKLLADSGATGYEVVVRRTIDNDVTSNAIAVKGQHSLCRMATRCFQASQLCFSSDHTEPNCFAVSFRVFRTRLFRKLFCLEWLRQWRKLPTDIFEQQPSLDNFWHLEYIARLRKEADADVQKLLPGVRASRSRCS